MRTAITLARRHGSDTWRLLHGPEVGIAEQRAELKAAQASRMHPEFEEVQIWESGAGLMARKKFDAPAATEAPKAKAAKELVPADSEPTSREGFEIGTAKKRR